MGNNTQHDGYRQSIETEALKNDTLINAYLLRAGDELCKRLNSKHCEGSKVISNSETAVVINDEDMSVSGTAKYMVKTYYKGLPKIAEFTVEITKNALAINDKQFIEILDKATDCISVAASIPMKSQISKQAAAGMSGRPLLETLKINKEFLPTCTKEGDVYFLGGAKYRVITGDEGKMSLEGTGPYWTLGKLVDVVQKDDKVII